MLLLDKTSSKQVKYCISKLCVSHSSDELMIVCYQMVLSSVCQIQACARGVCGIVIR